MFANLELFLQEKEVYKSKVEELKNSIQDPQELNKKLEEETEKFKGRVRKYLSSAISTINTNFQCQYSIYKIGKDVDANFHVVETNVKKNRSEVIADMEEFKKQAASLTLSNSQITKINVAMEVLLTYCDEEEGPIDETKENFLNNSKVVATSIIDKPKQTSALPPEQPSEPNFNPYANQPIDTTPAPVQEKKPLVDPFANIYGGDSSAPISPDAIPMASPDFVDPQSQPPVVPTPMPNTNMNPNPTAIFGQEAASNFAPANYNNSMNNMYPQNQSFDNTQSFQQPMTTMNPDYSQNNYMANSYGGNLNQSYYDNNAMMNQSYNTMNMNALPGMVAGSASSNSYSYALNSENIDSRVQAITGQNLNGNPDEMNQDPQKGLACIISKILKGFLRIPITSLLFLGIVMLIFWGLDKANLLQEIGKTLGDYMFYAEFAVVLFLTLIGASTVLDSMAAKTKYISKHAIASLTIFSGTFYGLQKLVPMLTNDILTDMVDSEILIQVAFYFLYYVAIAYFISSFVWLISFMRTDKTVLKRKRLNLVEMVGSLWCVYTLVLPAISVGCQACGLDIWNDKLGIIYSYDNFEWIVIIASFVLSAGILLFSKLEEKKL